MKNVFEFILSVLSLNQVSVDMDDILSKVIKDELSKLFKLLFLVICLNIYSQDCQNVIFAKFLQMFVDVIYIASQTRDFELILANLICFIKVIFFTIASLKIISKIFL